MKIPQLRKQPEKKSCHGYSWKDDYSWIHQDNCLEILRDTSKLNPEVRQYLEEENIYTKKNMKDTENLQKKLFREIEGRIKLEDESLHHFHCVGYLKAGFLAMSIERDTLFKLSMSSDNKKLWI